MTEQRLIQVRGLVNRISTSVLGVDFKFILQRDIKLYKKALQGDAHEEDARPFVQLSYAAPCSKIGTEKPWKGRKWYLSEHMTDDEVIKTCYVAFKAAVEHEVLEGFKIDGQILFNPHTPYDVILSISHKEVERIPLVDAC